MSRQRRASRCGPGKKHALGTSDPATYLSGGITLPGRMMGEYCGSAEVSWWFEGIPQSEVRQ
jgi:hypothetical protein